MGTHLMMMAYVSMCVCGAGVLTTTDVDEATKGVEVAVMVGGFPRKVRGRALPGMLIRTPA